MKNQIVLILLLLAAFSATAQWTDISSGKIGPVSACYMLDAHTCVATGNNGMVYITHDRGITYDSVQTVFTAGQLKDIEFVNDSVGFICGGSLTWGQWSFLLRTTDRGQSWDSVAAHIGGGIGGTTLYHLDFVDEQLGFLSGLNEQWIYKTTDGGQTFTQHTMGGGSMTAKDLHAVDSQTIYVVSREALGGNIDLFNRIDKSITAGQTWTPVLRDTVYNLTQSNSRNYDAIFFRSPTDGFASGANARLIHTTDGGASWNLSILASDSSNLIQILFPDSLHGFIAATTVYGPRRYFYTTDGGQSWQRGDESFIYMSMSGTQGYAVGYDLKLYTNQDPFVQITDPSEKIQMEVFPNPAKDQLNLRVTPAWLGSQVTVVDLSGRTLLRESLKRPEQSIDIHSLGFGTYLVILEHPTKGRLSKKFSVGEQ